MGKRKWQTVVFILLIGLLSFAYIRLNDLFFSPEEVFWSCERGLQSGPSEEILLEYESADGGLILVGRQKDGLFVVPEERSHFFLWKMQKTIDGEYYCDGDVDGYYRSDGVVLGLCKNPEITEVSFILGEWSELSWKEYTCKVEDNGLIWYDTKVQDIEKYVNYWEGRNADGEVIYREGDANLAESLRKGNIRPGNRTVTKPFITAPVRQE